MEKDRPALRQRFPGCSVGTMLTCLVLLAALPATAVIVSSSFEARTRAEDEARAGLANMAQSLAAIQRGITGNAEGLLAALAQTEDVRQEDAPACSRLFVSLLREHPELSNIFMTDAAGLVTAAGLAPFVGENLADRRYFQDAVATGGFAVGEFLFGRTTRKPILVFALPRKDGDGRLRGIIGMSYYLDGYERFLGQLRLPAHVRTTLLDVAGRRMVSYPPRSGYALGEPAYAPVWAAIEAAGTDGGGFAGVRMTGESALFRFIRLRLAPGAPPYATVVVSSPLGEAYAQADALLRRGLLLAGVVVLLALAIARVLGRLTIGNAVAGLAAVAGRLAAGDLSARTRTNAGLAEVRELGRSFNEMAVALQSRQQELAETARALGKTRNMLNNILESMPSALVGVDAAGRVTHINAKAKALFGLDDAGAVGRDVPSALPFLAPQMENLEIALRERRSLAVERVPMRQDGQTHLLNMLFYPLLANGAEGVVIRLDDVTERERLRELMIQTEKMMSVGGLAAGMAHEINNPLSSILQAAQVIDMQLDPAAPANVAAAAGAGCTVEAVRAYLEARRVLKFLAGIREAGSRAAKIVAGMLEFSRPSASRREAADINALVEKGVYLAENDYDLKKKYDFRHIRIVRELDPSRPMAVCAATEIEQVLLNLLKNAAHAMAGDAAPDREPTIVLRTRGLPDAVEIEVADNGPGMEEAVRSRIFEPFFTTKPPGEGTGLGLSVSYCIIANNHGGSIRMESEPGRGSACIIALPRGGAAP